MALVLVLVGGFVYLRLAAELDEGVDQTLRSQSAAVTALIREEEGDLGDEEVSELAGGEGTFVQVLSPDDRVLDATPGFADQPLLPPAGVAAAGGPLTVEREVGDPIDEEARLLATPVEVEGRELVAVVGASLDDREEALDNLATLLLIGGPVTLLLASVAGYSVVSAALRPVEAMRREAAAVSVDEPGRRLPVPPARDRLARLGQTLNEMLRRNEVAFERERTFVSDASHELRTPLATLRTELEVALRGEISREEALESLRLAADETERLSLLAEDLLVIARADQGRLPVRLERVAAAGVLEGAGQRLGRRFADAGRALEVDEATGIAMLADPLRAEQALTNLLDNALRHGDGPVSLWASRNGSTVELHVSDEGRGVPTDYLDHAFERFTRAEESRTGAGAGLGLAIVDVIARAQGGSAHLRNRREGGADAWLVLPAAD